MSQLGLGEIMQLRGWITRGQLVRALAQQRKYGGRLGTSLLEIGAITEEQLLTILAKRAGVPRGPIDGLRDLPRGLSSVLPLELARRRRVLPIAEADGTLSVAFEDAGDLAARDEVAFATNRKIHPLGLHEARIYEGLEGLYGLECPPRISRLLKQLNRSRPAAPRKVPDPEPTQPADAFDGLGVLDGPIATPVPRSHRPRQLSAPEGGSAPEVPRIAEAPGIVEAPEVPGIVEAPEVPGAPEIAEAPEVPESPEPPATAHRLRIVELTDSERAELSRELGEEELAAMPLEERLQRATRASEVGEILLAHLARSYRRVALLRPAGGDFKGWMARGEGLDPDTFAQLRIGAEEPSAFLNLLLGGSFHIGPLPHHETNRRLLSCWGPPAWPESCGIVPLTSHQHTLCLMYVDGPIHSPETDLGELQEAAAGAVKAFENCILRNRLQSERARNSV